MILWAMGNIHKGKLRHPNPNQQFYNNRRCTNFWEVDSFMHTMISATLRGLLSGKHAESTKEHKEKINSGRSDGPNGAVCEATITT